ncbi:MAG: adenylosuccinate synthetase [Saprospiraceae bacterium]|nr:adenylosuccinate synthetase [Saprospiraceae bacterium]
MKTKIVLGLGYGDEGKGLTTDYLCQQTKQPLVIRFSGGHQAGHTVVTEKGERHVFSSFGAGGLQGVPTYWSSFCTLSPINYMNEWLALRELGHTPTLFVDSLAPITTPYDVFFNRHTEKKNQHGSCGLGFGATIARQLTPYKFYAQDLLYPKVVEQKLKAIAQYYAGLGQDYFTNAAFLEQLELFQRAAQDITDTFTIVQEKIFFTEIAQQFSDLIFEGSQGILLDMDFGFFPNVTRCSTTSRNAFTLMNRNRLPMPEIFYITRAYQTRHGNGFLSNEQFPLHYTPNPQETNQFNPWQGHQRCSILDLDMLNYALACDHNYSENAKKHLVVSCLDQLEGPIQASQDGIIHHFASSLDLLKHLNISFASVLESWSECGAKMRTQRLSYSGGE